MADRRKSRRKRVLPQQRSIRINEEDNRRCRLIRAPVIPAKPDLHSPDLYVLSLAPGDQILKCANTVRDIIGRKEGGYANIVDSRGIAICSSDNPVCITAVSVRSTCIDSRSDY